MIINIMLMFVIVALLFIFVAKKIKQNKQEEVKAIEVDDKTYTLELMVKFVKRRLDEITKEEKIKNMS